MRVVGINDNFKYSNGIPESEPKKGGVYVVERDYICPYPAHKGQRIFDLVGFEAYYRAIYFRPLEQSDFEFECIESVLSQIESHLTSVVKQLGVRRTNTKESI